MRNAKNVKIQTRIDFINFITDQNTVTKYFKQA